MRIRTVGIIGAGEMGRGVAQVLIHAGYDVVLIDLTQHALENARREIKKGLRFQGFLTKQKEASDPQALLEKITFTSDYRLLAGADIVIENVTEKWDVKREVYVKIDTICPEHCIFASNTSAIPITRIASVTGRASKVIGMHFMNPVPMKPVVEVIRGYHTSDETVEKAKAFLNEIGKECVVVNDSPGFASNRVLMLAINEAIFLLHERVATVEEVDKIFKSCFGHKMGPFETADLIGLDTVLYTLEVLYESFNDSKYRPCPLLKEMVDAGLLGRKSGEGFYNYRIEGFNE